MYFVTCISLLAIILTYLSQYKNYNILFKLAFLFITIIACIHYNFGTDYDNYYDLFRELSRYSFEEVLQLNIVHVEPGWAFLNILFSHLGDPLGFFVLVCLLNIIQNYIYYVFIKKYVCPKYRWLALTIYLFSSTFYILNFSMMRQGLAVSLVVLATMLLSNQKYLYALLIVLLSSCIHKSALIFLLAFPVGLCKFENSRALLVILWGGVIIAFASSSMISSIYSSVIGLQVFEKYQGYEDFGTTSIGVGFFINLLPYLVITCMVFNKKILSKSMFYMSIIMFLSLILNAFTLKITLIGRLLFYFSVFSIVVIPNLYKQIKSQPIRLCLIFIYLFMILSGYSDYFKPSNWAYEDYKTFHTVFEAMPLI